MSKPQSVTDSSNPGKGCVPVTRTSKSDGSERSATATEEAASWHDKLESSASQKLEASVFQGQSSDSTKYAHHNAKSTFTDSASSSTSSFSQGRQPCQPFWAGVPSYFGQMKPLSFAQQAAWVSSSPVPSNVFPNMSAMSYSTQSTQPALKKAKSEAYEIDLTEDNEDDTVVPDRVDTKLTGTTVLPRQWEYTSYGRAHMRNPRSGVELTVLSYNVLSQSLLEDNSFLYPHCSPDVLNWDNRKTLLLDEMISYNADVLCLQEVQSNHYNDYFLPHFTAAGYQGVYQKRTGTKPDGCAVFVKRDKLTISSAFPVIYNRGDILDRDNIALIVQLRSRDSTTRKHADVFIATTHLLFNPRRGDIKLAQLSVLLAELDRLTNRGSSPGGFPTYAPVILCGDFNTEPHSDIYKFVVRGYLRYEGLIRQQLSGQRERCYGNDVFLSNQLLHPSLGITDQCQYVRSLYERNVFVPDCVREAATSGGEVTLAARLFSPAGPSTAPWGARGGYRPRHRNSPPVSLGLGCLWHNLNFVSTYNHTIERLGHSTNEVTSQHKYASCTLDYIFYNVQRKRARTHGNRVKLQNVEEDKLYLIGRYGLLSGQEVVDVGGLPNHLLGSDHLGLLAKFLLKYS